MVIRIELNKKVTTPSSGFFFNLTRNIRSKRGFVMQYTYHSTDEFVKNLYSKLSINKPPDLSAERIASLLYFTVDRVPARSMRIGTEIYLDSRLSTEEQWERFGHELCHVLWHQDNQLHLTQSFVDLQERQANNFALYACVPTDMLLSMPLPSAEREAVGILVETFNVTPEFAIKRLKLHLSRLYETTP